jgi:ankyrin repeat protein
MIQDSLSIDTIILTHITSYYLSSFIETEETAVMHNQVDELEELDLHDECKKQCRSSFIQRYIELYPEALAKADRFSNLPLHLLLKNPNAWNQPAISELVVDMIDKYPAALQHRDGDGRLPLHLECIGQCRSSIIAKYIELYPDALAKADRFSSLPLYLLLRNPNTWNQPAITELALDMIDKYPAALQQQNGDGRLPLHIECMGPCRSSIIAKSIELYPESLRIVDDDGYLPLHLLLGNRSSSVEDALMMMEIHAAGLEVQEKDGHLPLHIECMYQSRLSIISKCIELYPEALFTADETEHLPLHILLVNEAATADQALMMIERYPAAMEHAISDGHLPLHLECVNQCRSSIISKCIELYPEALSIADLQEYLPLHRLLLNNQSSADQALMLIEKYPEALNYPYRGYFPLHMECHSRCRSSIISKCIELYPGILDDKAVVIIIAKVNKGNFLTYAPALLVIFAARPMSLYDREASLKYDIRVDPRYRRRMLKLLPRHVFTPTHESDYRDLNWQPRAAMTMLLSQMQIQHIKVL